MISIVDLRDFAEICRAIDTETLYGIRIDAPVEPHRRTSARVRKSKDATIANGGARSRRFYRKPRARPDLIDPI